MCTPSQGVTCFIFNTHIIALSVTSSLRHLSVAVTTAAACARLLFPFWQFQGGWPAHSEQLPPNETPVAGARERENAANLSKFYLSVAR